MMLALRYKVSVFNFKVFLVEVDLRHWFLQH